MQSVPVRPSTKQRFILRRRFEFLGALVIAALLPWAAMRWLVDDPTFTPAAFHNSMIVNAVAIFIALWTRMSVETYPGIRSGQTIFPAILASHALVIGALLLLRLPYHRPTLLAGFVLHFLWAYAIYFFVARRLRPRIAIVPLGHAEELRDIDSVDWVRLSRPDLSQVDGCNAIVADFSAELPDNWEMFLADAALEGRVVYQVEQLRESLTGRVQVRHLSENSFGSLVPARAYSTIKHAADWLAALAAMPLALPVMALCALAILLDDGGPVLFRQRRTGQGGRQFRVMKFRTMRVDHAPDGSREAAMTLDRDVRITRVGGFLRRSRIDELPQLFNILKGEMSFIGPRPEAEVLSAWYTGDIPFYRYRHVVRPGITGWAQVNQGHVAEVAEIFLKTQYDFFYIKYFSPWLDVLIAFRTVKTMLTGWGAR
ncbi:sugar transferase [Sphingomonas mesophila]|uniref:sugar transferase n=1 Tax=Sphingomonas mesophila TaxID=2303576 RepID=UPI0013C2FC9F|nr:sugar transferase [Sphingomonas mesophila]